MTRNPLYITLGIIVLLAGGYLFYRQTQPATALGTVPGPASSAEQSFVTLVGELAPVAFNKAVLTDPRLTSLTDIRTEVVPEPPGRRDPFAPVPGVLPTN